MAARRTLELGLLLLIAFGPTLVVSLHHWWTGMVESGVAFRQGPLLGDLIRLIRAVPAIVLLVYILRGRGRTLRQIGLTTRWSDFALGLALAALVLPRRSALWSPPVLYTEVLQPLSVAGIFCAAAKEELIVRAYMMSEVRDLTGSAFLAIASSTCFQALYHLYQGSWAALTAALTFLIYSVFYWKTRRVTPIVLAHFAHNFWLALLGV